MPPTSWPSRTLQFLASAALVLGLLWWLQSILVPLALGTLFAFLLSPPVSWLQRRGVPRAIASLAMVALALALMATIGWTVSRQVTRLVDDFPQYQEHLDAKIASMRSDGSGFIDKVQRIVARVSSQIDRISAPRGTGPRATAHPPVPQPVTVVDGPGPFQLLRAWKAFGPLLEPLASAALTLVLVLFMLLRREDLRDRFIAVLGQGRLVAATRAIDDAASRISRYLLRQLLVNSMFGILLGLGLAAIGIPYAFLWGALAALLRYVPYVGTWLAAFMPVALSLIVDDGWQPTLWVVLLFAALELVVNMLVEPHVYGRSIGVSETGTLVMVAFWTWLWGPVGLVLATPLTVCTVVLGKYLPALQPLSLLLGDKPALRADVRFYQRLLAGDLHEATSVANHADDSPGDALDEILRPALGYLRRDALRGRLTPEDERAALAMCDEVAAQMPSSAAAAEQAQGPAVLLVPTLAAASRSAAALFAQWLAGQSLRAMIAPEGVLNAEVAALAEEQAPFAVVICVVGDAEIAQARLLCLRLRHAHRELPIVAGLWFPGALDEDDAQERLLEAGANQVAADFEATRRALLAWRQLQPA